MPNGSCALFVVCASKYPLKCDTKGARAPHETRAASLHLRSLECFFVVVVVYLLVYMSAKA